MLSCCCVVVLLRCRVVVMCCSVMYQLIICACIIQLNTWRGLVHFHPIHPYLIHAVCFIDIPVVAVQAVVQSVRLHVTVEISKPALRAHFRYLRLKTQVHLEILFSVDG